VFITKSVFVKRIFILPICIAAIVLSAVTGSVSRDINLDTVYIKQSSAPSKKIFETKLEAYQKAHSVLVDRNVIFADWINGFEILFIRETESVNIVYRYNRKQSAATEMFRFDGTVTLARTGFGGRYLFVKRIIIHDTGVPSGNGFCYDLLTKSRTPIPGEWPFLDFTIAPSGNSIFISGRSGIVETDLNAKLTRQFLPREKYSDIIAPGSPVFAFLAPNRNRVLVMSGSGGNYRARLISGNRSWQIASLTSPSELFWISNSDFVYRGGGTGSYSVSIYNTATRKSRDILQDSLHTSISFSPSAKVLSFLKDQMICIYRIRENQFFNTGLEGDDVSFSPDGNRFVSILSQRLFLTNLSTVMNRQRDLSDAHETLAGIYSALLKDRSSWDNEYSPVYLQRKIALYRQMTSGISGFNK
jgi:hypothetical protein